MKCILDAYEECFGQDFDHSIVSKKKCKIELDPNLGFPGMKQALDKWYRVADLRNPRMFNRNHLIITINCCKLIATV